jgi:hypothetical protein
VRLRLLPRRTADRSRIEAEVAARTADFLKRCPSPDVVDRSRFAQVASDLAGLEGRDGHDGTVRPNNSAEFLPYVREHDDYGHGEAVAAVERHFQESNLPCPS